MLGGILGILIAVAALLVILGQKAAAGKVISSPFTLFGWVFRGLLGASGRGTRQLIRDTYRQCLHRWPGRTLAVCWGGVAMAILLLILAVLSAGCGITSGIRTETVEWGKVTMQGNLTPTDAKVPKQEWTSPGIWRSWGRGAATSCPTGTIMGPQIPPVDGKVYRADRVGGC